MHKHHIIPKHMGGSNHPDNLIELSVEDHADAHRKLYEEHGHWQDRIAWKALSGQIGKEEIQREIIRHCNTGLIRSEETKQKIRDARKQQSSSGWRWSDASRAKHSKLHKGKVLSEEHKAAIGAGNRGKAKPKTTCPHCGKIGGVPQMKQWHFDNCKDIK